GLPGRPGGLPRQTPTGFQGEVGPRRTPAIERPPAVCFGHHAASTRGNSMKTLHRTALAVLFSGYAAVAVAQSAQPPAAPQKQVLTIGYVKVGHLSPMIFVSEPLKACNVEVKPVEFVRYADARTALLSGSIDVSGI